MFEKRTEKREATRRHRQIMNAAYHLIGPSFIVDRTLRLTPEAVVALVYGRHQIRITAEEAKDALGAALLERGYSLDRIATT